MRIHRSARTRFYTKLGNEVLRDGRLSFCARGILGYLVSLPDGQRGDIRTLVERTPEGRERVASALRELERFGYLKRVVKRTPDSRIYTEVEVFDAAPGPPPLVTPKPRKPGSGGAAPGEGVDHPENELGEGPTHPSRLPKAVGAGRAGQSVAEHQAGAELLARVARIEPRLAMGSAEALRLAPLVIEWKQRGASDLHVITALTAGLPRGGVHYPARFLETRLRTKMPVERRAAPLLQHECDACGAPVSTEGQRRPCSTPLDTASSAASIDFAQVRSRGAALARAALRGLSIDSTLPAPA